MSPRFTVEAILRTDFMQRWLNLSDPLVEEALHDVPVFRDFAGLAIGVDHLFDENTILDFRHLLQGHVTVDQILAAVNQLLTDRGLLLKAGTTVDAAIIAAPGSTKNKEGRGDPQMHQTKKSNPWHFGMTSRRRRTPAGRSRAAGCGHKRSEAAQVMHVGVDTNSVLVDTVVDTAANAHDGTQEHKLLHGKEEDVFADSDYRDAHKRHDVIDGRSTARRNVAIMTGKRRALDKTNPEGKLTEEFETIKSAMQNSLFRPFGQASRLCSWQCVHRPSATTVTAQPEPGAKRPPPTPGGQPPASTTGCCSQQRTAPHGWHRPLAP